MKYIKSTLATTVALTACMGMQAFADNTKEGVITFALSLQAQKSVSTTTGDNVGNWSQLPTHYKTAASRLTDKDLIHDISWVLHGKANYYSANASLVLIQGELSGFFNVIPGLAHSTPTTDPLDGTFNTDSSTGDNTALSAGTVTYVTLANGRNYQTNSMSGAYPVGHFQPWGQIFVQDPKNAATGGLLCENVTYFFDMQVQECYDCFYLNSFITDASFNYKKTGGGSGGPPCCSLPVTSTLFGNGRDRYYLTMSFDDTALNPYLDPADPMGVYTGNPGITPSVGNLDGTKPDGLTYVDAIKSGLGTPSPYEARFTLNGILTYAWNLKLINSSDVLPDFIGTATYAANGYGFIQLYCTLINGTGRIAEKVVKSSTCCTDIPWYDSWYGVGSSGDPHDSGYVVVEEGYGPTTEENVPLSLSYHNPDWNGGVTYGGTTY